MTPHPPLFHSLLRPCILQILRAQGYHAARSTVVDSLTDMTARYLTALCEATASHAAHNSSLWSAADVEDDGAGKGATENGGGVYGRAGIGGIAPTVVDVRMALEDCGAVALTSPFEGPDWSGDDTRGIDEFIDWVCGPRNREIKRVALDGDDENTDYLSALRKKHSKTGEDSKYSGTVLGRGNEHAADVVVEGGEFPSIQSWQEKRIEAHVQPRLATPPPPPPTPPPESPIDNKGDDMDTADDADRQVRSPSSGLSSLGDRSIDEEMELEFAVQTA